MTASTVVTDYLKIFAGTPTGTPPINTGAVALGWDDTNKLLYAYSWTASAWKPVGGGGSSFSPFNDAGAIALTKPTAAGFTITKNANLSTAGSVTDLASRGITIAVPEHTSNADNALFASVAVPSVLTFTMTAFVQMFGIDYNTFCGLAVKDISGKLTEFGLTGNTAGPNPRFFQGNYSALGSFASSAFIGGSASIAPINTPLWLRLQLTGGNYIFSVSMDGESFDVLQTTTATAYLTTPATVGLLVDKNSTGVSPNNGWNARMNCYSFTATNP